uniref:Uncharacterized protein n=1 Tax=Octopus bimaculoides TaxID=37653 RepID=A0A0L8GZB3_OCTBM
MLYSKISLITFKASYYNFAICLNSLCINFCFIKILLIFHKIQFGECVVDSLFALPGFTTQSPSYHFSSHIHSAFRYT